ncbi:hypothetical protein HK103_002927 [Boothiomyces macroporosus]|uniref:Uncharacterized protein n=1 Tax=Boothiomyces macroporosus TaxID=261099 RepID=A0AAD5XZW5_9FUNG|nr:hypothetical protein HK103_002927 [Boothiomyces macroporosus]
MKFILLASLAFAKRHSGSGRHSLHPHGEPNNYPGYSDDELEYSNYDSTNSNSHQYQYSPSNDRHGDSYNYAEYHQDHYSLHPHGKSLRSEMNVFAFSSSFGKAFSLNSDSAPSGNLKYRGGPVVSNIEVTPIYYGNFKYMSEITAFYKGIVDSTYMDWLSEYNTHTQKIGRGKGFGGIIVKNPKKTVTTSDLEMLFDTLIEQRFIKPNQNSYYPIHFAKGITVTSEAGMCSKWCAYHSSFTTKSGVLILYGIIPDLDDQGCAGACGLSSDLNNIMSTSAHELIETVTDPISHNLAWYDDGDDKGEIADICNQMQGNVIGGDGNSYVVQLQWSNKEQKCRL